MPTINATIKWVTNTADLKRELKAGTDQLVVLQTAAEGATRRLGGEGLIRAASNAAAAVRQLGGVSTLTAREAEKLSSLFTRAGEKLTLMGKGAGVAATEFKRLAISTNEVAAAGAKLEPGISGAAGAFGKLNGVLGAFGAAVSVGAVVSFAKHTFDAASQIHDMALQLGISTDAVQGFAFAAEQSGSTLDAVGTAIGKLNANLSVGSKATVDALTDLHLGFSEIRAMKPEDAFLAITDALANVDDAMKQTELGRALFGKGFGELQAAINSGFRQMSDGARKWSKEQIDALEAAQDSMAEFGKHATLVMGTFIGDMMKVWDQARIIGPGIARALGSILTGNGLSVFRAMNVASSSPNFRQDTLLPDEFVGPRRSAASKPFVTAEQTSAIEAHAKAIASLMAAFSGADKIKAAKDALEAFNANAAKGIPLARMTEEQQAALNKTLDAALDVYAAMGQTAPEAMRALWFETQKLGDSIKIVDGLDASISRIGQTAHDTVPFFVELAAAANSIKTISGLGGLHLPGAMNLRDIGLPRLAQGWTSLFGGGKQLGADLSASIMGAIQGGGNLLNAAGGVIGTKLGTGLANTLTSGMTGWLGGALNSVLPMLGSLLGPLLGAIGSWVKSLFGNATKDLIKETFGSYDALRERLLVLGAEGERLWIELTQRTGRNDTSRAAALIEEITRKLDEEAAAARAAEQAVTDSMQAAVDGAQQAVTALDQEIASLQQSIANEAPEEVMGVIEAQARARIAALEAERAVAVAHVEELQQALTASMNRVAAAIEHLPRDVEMRVRIRYDDGTPPVESYGSRGGLVTASGLQYFDMGGFVRGLARGSDTVPAMLTPGEVVLTPQQQREFGGDTTIVVVSGAGSGEDVITRVMQALPRKTRFNESGFRTSMRDALGIAGATA